MPNPSVSLIVQHVTPELRAALLEDARRRDVSINEAAVAPLAQAYGVPRTPSGIRFDATSFTISEATPDTMTLRIPLALRKKLRRRAASKDVTIGGLVLACLCEHYGLPVESARRKQRS